MGLCCRHGGAKRKRKTPDEADTDEEEECIKAQQGEEEDEKMPAIADEANDVPVAQVVNGKTEEEEETETVQI